MYSKDQGADYPAADGVAFTGEGKLVRKGNWLRTAKN